MSDKVLQINDLKIYYPVRKGLMGQLQYVKAVDGVTLDVKKGEVLGIVGESGCGKSTLGKAVCRLIPISGGQIILNDKDITTLPEKELRSMYDTYIVMDEIGSLASSLGKIVKKAVLKAAGRTVR